jgi:adenylate cyclase class 2
MANYEVELKFPLQSDPQQLQDQLARLNAKPLGTCQQEDSYFSHPQRDFQTTGEALRIRRDGDNNAITYKGPLLDNHSKTRQEIEVAFATGERRAEQMWAILRALGFRDVRRVRKTRQSFSLNWEEREFHVALDQVDDLGQFVELETLTREEDWQSARDSVLRLASALNLKDSERRSYLELLLERDADSVN